MWIIIFCKIKFNVDFDLPNTKNTIVFSFSFENLKMRITMVWRRE